VIEKIPCKDLKGYSVPKLTLKDSENNDVQLACGFGEN
jgi:hypothetical protein